MGLDSMEPWNARKVFLSNLQRRSPERMEVSPSTPPNSSAFLPSFLFGETEVSEEQRSRIGGLLREDSLTSPLSHKNISPVKADYNRGTKIRLTGPPIQSLFEEAESPTKLNNTSISSPPWLNASARSNETSLRDEDLWVVVFGFTPAATGHVLNLFNQCGRVVENTYPPAGGNWMMVRFEDKQSVRKALAFNTRIVGGNIMLGVVERKKIPNLRVTEAEKENNTSNIMVSPNTSRVRHLGPSKQTPQSPGAESVPKKDTSVISRAMDVLFGW